MNTNAYYIYNEQFLVDVLELIFLLDMFSKNKF